MSSFLNGLSVFLTILILLFSYISFTFQLDQKAVLRELWDATNGTYWNDTTNWISDNNECSWFGVVCENSSIIELNIPKNGLDGTIPSSIANLTYLRNLVLSNNDLFGSIPSSIGELALLEKLWLDLNYLTGIIPTSFSQLSHLNRLVLDQNHLSGDISFLTSLISLTNVDLYYNDLSGAIPQDIGLLTNLKKFWVNHNYLTGTIPTSIAHLTDLRYLDLSQNNLSGQIPPQLGLLVNLETLNLTDNKFNGSLPKQLENILHLKELFLYNNHLSGGCFPFNYSVPYCNIGDWKFGCLCPQQPDTCPSGTCSLQVDLNPYTHWLVLLHATYNVTDPLLTLKNANLSLQGTTLNFVKSLILNHMTVYLVGGDDDGGGGRTGEGSFPSTIVVNNKLTINNSVVYNVNPSFNVIKVSGCVSLNNVTFYFPWQSTFSPFLSAGCFEVENVEAKLLDPTMSVPNYNNTTTKNTTGICYDTVLTKQDNSLGVVMVEKSCIAQQEYVPLSDVAMIGMGVVMGVVGTLLIAMLVCCVFAYTRSKNQVQKVK